MMQMLMLPRRQLFICDTHVNRDPSGAEVAEIALLAAEEVRRFGVTPRVALLSHSSFGSSDAPAPARCARRWRSCASAHRTWRSKGEMRGDAALSPDDPRPTRCRTRFGAAAANVLVMPNVDAANISYNLLRMAAGGGITVGGILLGAARPAHVLTPSATVRRIVNMTALAVVDASQRA